MKYKHTHMHTYTRTLHEVSSKSMSPLHSPNTYSPFEQFSLHAVHLMGSYAVEPLHVPRLPLYWPARQSLQPMHWMVSYFVVPSHEPER
jgi:hypothetical protein